MFTDKLFSLLFTGILTFLFFGCSPKESKKEQPPQVINEVKPKKTLPVLPATEYNLLFQQCDFIDYIFIDLPFSLSQNEKASIQQNVLFIEKTGIEYLDPACKPMARKFFKIGGNIVWEADVFMSGNCTYFVFYKDNKAVYANKMSANGINFYNNLIDQASKMGQ